MYASHKANNTQSKKNNEIHKSSNTNKLAYNPSNTDNMPFGALHICFMNSGCSAALQEHTKIVYNINMPNCAINIKR